MLFAIDCRQSNKNSNWMCSSSIQSHLKYLFIITDYKYLLQKTISLIKALEIQRLCFIDGSPLQTTRREFCLWWSRSFENSGNGYFYALFPFVMVEHFLKLNDK